MSSQIGLMIESIHRAAQFHYKNCATDECGISVYNLKRAAARLLMDIPDSHPDREEFHKLEWPM